MTAPKLSPSDHYISDYDAIQETMDFYITGLRAGNGKIMSQAFLPDATSTATYMGTLQHGPMQRILDGVDQSGPAPDLVTRLAGVEIIGTIAVVRLEVNRWTGKLAPPEGFRMSDVFTLVKTEAGWKIGHKGFHLHPVQQEAKL
jgi:hypothetical protein